MNGLAKQTYFDKKLKSINKKVTLNEARHVETIFGGEGGGVERGGGVECILKVMMVIISFSFCHNAKFSNVGQQ